MRDIVLLTSVINPGNIPWTYSSVRSAFTPEQRFEQLRGSIQSVRTFLPSAEIIIIECSDIPESYETILKGSVEHYINLYNEDEIRKICVGSNKKALGEALQTKCALDYIITNKLSFKRFFKLSGRYYLTNKFKEELFSTEKFTFKKRIYGGDGSILHSTVLYSFPFSLFIDFYNNLEETIQYCKDHEHRGIEELLPPLCEPKVELEITGASGLVAVENNILIEA